jgi:hypothetical protein
LPSSASCPTHASVAGEFDSRYARIAAERDAAPRASECRPEIDEAIELCTCRVCYRRKRTLLRESTGVAEDRERRGAFPVVRSAPVKGFR